MQENPLKRQDQNPEALKNPEGVESMFAEASLEKMEAEDFAKKIEEAIQESGGVIKDEIGSLERSSVKLGTANPEEIAGVKEEVDSIEAQKKGIKIGAEVEINKLNEVLPADAEIKNENETDKEDVLPDEAEVKTEAGKESPEVLEQEIEALPQEEKEKIKLGLRNVGFFMEKGKSEFIAKGLEKCISYVGQEGAMGRFLNEIAETYKNDAQKAEKNMELAEQEGEGGRALQLANYGQVAKNILKFGGLATGRGIMGSGALFARGFEAVKEARLKNTEVVERNRMDVDAAAELAWTLYEKAQVSSGEENPKKDDLEKTYQKNIPAEMLKKLENSGENGAGIASGVMQKFAQKYLEFSAKRMDGKIKKIETNDKFDAKEKEQEIAAMLNKYKNQLKLIDQAVFSTGEIDLLAVGARAGELGGKAMMGVSMAQMLENVWDKLPDIVAEASASEIPSMIDTGYLKNLSILHPELNTTNAALAAMKIQNSPSFESGIFLRIMTKAGMPKGSESLGDYLQGAIAKGAKVTPHDLEKLVKLATGK